VYLQTIALRFLDEHGLDGTAREAFDRIAEACSAPHNSERARAAVLERICLDVYKQLFLDDGDRHPYTLLDWQRRHQILQDAGRAADGTHTTDPRL
jgi:hypothetical protein